MNIINKPYRKMTSKDPQGIPASYKDIVKTSPINEDQLQSIISNTTINTGSGSGVTLPIAESDVTGLVADLAAKEDDANKGAASGYASLNASTKVVEDPANATATPTASKIVIADSGGKVDSWVTDATTSAKGKVELATDGEVAANVVVQGNDSRLVRIASNNWYGDGADGSLTLGSNTTLASAGNVKRYTDLDLAGFDLKANDADQFILIFVSGTLTLNGGRIVNSTPAAGGVGGAGGSTPVSGVGGAGGGRAGAIFVYARNIVGTGTFRSGNDGVNAGHSTAGVGNTAGANGANPGTNQTSILGETMNGSTPGGGAAQSTGGAGTSAPGTAAQRRMFGIPHNFFFIRSVLAMTQWNNQSIPGGGGCSGETSLSARSGGGGGGGGMYGAGGNGGNGPSGTAGNTQCGSGGSGGGGSGGGLIVVVSDNCSSGLTINADGGNGGNGGNGRTSGTTVSGNGSGGGAGGGGIALLMAQAGCGATLTAAAGTAGGPGTGGVGGNSGAAGGAGYTKQFVI